MTTQRFALVMLDDPTGETAAGELFVVPGAFEWQPVEWLDPWNCEHVETMCAHCVESWSCDHEVQLPAGVEVAADDDNCE